MLTDQGSRSERRFSLGIDEYYCRVENDFVMQQHGKRPLRLE